MTNRRVGSTPSSATMPTWQQFAETQLVAGKIHPVSGMKQPQMIDGTTTVTFENIPQTYQDLKLTFHNMTHNTNNSTAYRLMIAVNGDTGATRYYSRAGFQATGGAQWNADNVNYWYHGYVYRQENTTWIANGDLTIPLYSQQMPYNVRGAYGQWWHMNQSTMPIMYGFQYYNTPNAALPVTSLVLTIDGNPGFRATSKITLTGINPK